MLCYALLPTARAAGTEPLAVSVEDVGYTVAETQAYLDALARQYQDSLKTEADALALREQALQSLADQAVLELKYRALGLKELSEEEKESLRQSTKEAYRTALDDYAAQLAQAYGVSAEEASESAEAILKLNGVTPERMEEEVFLQRKDMLLLERVASDVTVTDAETEDAYEQYYVAPCREAYEYDIASYETQTLLGGETSYYLPTGYRLIANILLPLPEDLSERMADGYERLTEAADKAKELNVRLSRASASGEDAAALQAESDAANDAYYALREQNEALADEALQALKGDTDEIERRLRAGESFDALMGELSADASMPEAGYPVHAESVRYAAAFRDAAMALQAVGDVSQPVATVAGVHILCYAGDQPSGAVPLTPALRRELSAQLLQNKQYARLEELLIQWRQEYDIRTEPTLLTLPEVDP